MNSLRNALIDVGFKENLPKRSEEQRLAAYYDGDPKINEEVNIVAESRREIKHIVKAIKKRRKRRA